MHINDIRRFIAVNPTIGEANLTTSQINKAVIKPQTIGTNQPYIQKYIGTNDPGTGVCIPCIEMKVL